MTPRRSKCEAGDLPGSGYGCGAGSDLLGMGREFPWVWGCYLQAGLDPLNVGLGSPDRGWEPPLWRWGLAGVGVQGSDLPLWH